MSLPIPVPDEALLDVPPDLFSRHYRVYAAVEACRRPGETFRILDIGGRAGLTSRFFASDEVVVVDIRDDETGVVAVEPGSPLPFDDGEFDLCVSFDVLEHVEPGHRETWVRELHRVCRCAGYFTLPSGAAIVGVAERVAADLYLQISGREHPWLTEHAEFGVPTHEQIASWLDATSSPWSRYSSNPLASWLPTMMAGFLRDELRDLQPTPGSMRALNERGLQGDCVEPGYRSIYVLARDDRDWSPRLDDVNRSGTEPCLIDVGPVLLDVQRSIDALRAALGDAIASHDGAVAARDAALERLRDAQTTQHELTLQLDRMSSEIGELAGELTRIRSSWWFRAGRRARHPLAR